MQQRRRQRSVARALTCMLLFGLTWSVRVDAQAPEWSVNPSEFAGTMSVTSMVMLSGEVASPDSGDRVGAFVNGQVRGVASPIQVGDRWFFFVTVFGQANGERVSFKYYSETGNAVHSVFEETTFGTDRILGSTTTPFLLTADASTSVRDATGTPAPAVVLLHGNYPEPFIDETTISYTLTRSGDVRLLVYNMLGQRVATVVDRHQGPGVHEAQFLAGSLPDGRYFYQLFTPDATVSRPMTLLR